MIELLVAYLLWEGGAGAEWWAAYGALLIYKAYQYWQFKRALDDMQDEILKDFRD